MSKFTQYNPTWLQLGYNLVIFVKFFQLKLKTLNLIFSASGGPN